MTKARIVDIRIVICALLSAASMVLANRADAWENQSRPILVAPSPSAKFQQTVQQQQTNNQLQQNQLQSQLRQSVATTARLPSVNNAQAQKQADQAEQAQRDRDRAAQQDLIDRQQAKSQLPRVVPNQPNHQPASSHSG